MIWPGIFLMLEFCVLFYPIFELKGQTINL